MVTTGILPLQGKIPMVEPGIEPGTSWLVVRSSDHQTTRLIPRFYAFKINGNFEVRHPRCVEPKLQNVKKYSQNTTIFILYFNYSNCMTYN